MKRISAFLLALLLCVSSANATVRNVVAGADQLQTAINASSSGDTIICAAGTYTFTSYAAILLVAAIGGDHDPGAGTDFLNLTIRGVSAATTIFDIHLSGGNDILYGGGAEGVTIANIWFQGVMQGAFLHDGTNSDYKNWTWQNCKFTGLTTTPFKFQPTWDGNGTGITIKNCKTTSTFAAPFFVDVWGNTVDLDMHILGNDCTLHTTGSMTSAIRLIDCRDAAVNYNTAYACNGISIQGNSLTVGKGLYDCEFVGNTIDGAGTALGPGIHVGYQNNDATRVTDNCWVAYNHITNINSYGIEMEGGVTDSQIVGNFVQNTQINGIPIPDGNRHILVAYNTIDGVTGNFPNGIALVYTAYCTVIGNVIKNVVGTGGNGCAILCSETGDIYQENQWDVIRDNVFINVDSAYHVSTAAMNTLAIEATKAITAASNATPIVITSAAHGYDTGNTVVVASVGGNTAANGTWIVTALSANTYSLNTSVGNGAYTSGGTGARYTPQTVSRNMFGPNQYSNALVYCTIDGVNKTQAQFVSTFPLHIGGTDTQVPAAGWNVGGPARSTGGVFVFINGE